MLYPPELIPRYRFTEGERPAVDPELLAVLDVFPEIRGDDFFLKIQLSNIEAAKNTSAWCITRPFDQIMDCGSEFDGLYRFAPGLKPFFAPASIGGFFSARAEGSLRAYTDGQVCVSLAQAAIRGLVAGEIMYQWLVVNAMSSLPPCTEDVRNYQPDYNFCLSAAEVISRHYDPVAKAFRERKFTLWHHRQIYIDLDQRVAIAQLSSGAERVIPLRW